MNSIRRFFRIVYGVSVLIVVLSAATGAAYVTGNLPEKVRLEEIEKIIHVPEPERSVDELIQDIAPRYGVNPVVLRAIVARESGGKEDAIRFEPGQMGRAAKITKNPEQQRMLASSHGVAQIMGWWSPHFNIRWSDLYDPRTNLEVACAILRKGLDRRKGKPSAVALRGALEEYNGSSAYADAVMRQIGDALIEKHL